MCTSKCSYDISVRIKIEKRLKTKEIHYSVKGFIVAYFQAILMYFEMKMNKQILQSKYKPTNTI